MKRNVFNIERDVVVPALQAAADSDHADKCSRGGVMGAECNCHVGRAKLALSFWGEFGHFHGPLCDELTAAIGGNDWAIARKGAINNKTHAPYAICLTTADYDLAQKRAVVARAAGLGVSLTLRTSTGKLEFRSDKR